MLSTNLRYNLGNNNNNTYLYSALFTLCSNALLKKTVIPLLNTHRSYTEKMKVLAVFLTLLWNQPSGYFVVVQDRYTEESDMCRGQLN